MEYDTNKSLRHLSLLSIVYRTAHDDTSNPSPLDEPDKLLLQISLSTSLFEVIHTAKIVHDVPRFPKVYLEDEAQMVTVRTSRRHWKEGSYLLEQIPHLNLHILNHFPNVRNV